MRVEGLLPDGASDAAITTRDGSTIPLSPQDGIYIAETQAIPDQVSWTQAGTREQAALPVPADAQAQVGGCR